MTAFDGVLIGVVIACLICAIQIFPNDKNEKKRAFFISGLCVLIIAILVIFIAAFKFQWDSEILGIPTDEPPPTTEAAESTAPETPDPPIKETTVSTENIKMGDTITFGAYEQDGNPSNRQEPIEWVVLDKADDKVLVLSTEALDCKPYNNQDSDCTWATCSLRKWLNGTFYKAAFSNKERERIADTTVEAHTNPDFSTNPGMSTHDYIFLLSVEEVNQYLPYNSDRMCVPTEYAKEQGGFEEQSLGTCWWWLRTPGETSSDASSINSDGTIDTDDGTVSSNKGCVRPAMWLAIGE